MSDLVQIQRRQEVIKRVPRGETPVVELHLEDNQEIHNYELREIANWRDRKTVDWQWTADIVTRIKPPLTAASWLHGETNFAQELSA